MKKIILSIATILTANVASSQWISKNVDNGFDEAYRICYTKENNGAVLKMENSNGEVAFYIQGSYFCTDEPTVDISFLVNGVWQKYGVRASRNQQGNVLFLVDDLETSEGISDFLKATSIKLRVNEEYCDNQIFQFSMSGSSAAYKFIDQ
jgi:hypothetical protein